MCYLACKSVIHYNFKLNSAARPPSCVLHFSTLMRDDHVDFADENISIQEREREKESVFVKVID